MQYIARALLGTSILYLLSPLTNAQSIGSGPLATTSLPAGSTAVWIGTVLGLAIIAYIALRNKTNTMASLIAPAILAGGAGVLLLSPELRALPSIGSFQFTNPNGQVIDVSAEYNSFTVDFEFTNASGVSLKIRSVTEPDGCPSVTPSKTASTSTEKGDGPVILQSPGYPNCEVGLILNNGDTCYKDFLPSGCIL